jgi:hypothetical protein
VYLYLIKCPFYVCYFILKRWILMIEMVGGNKKEMKLRIKEEVN